jgi:hypothetical protein
MPLALTARPQTLPPEILDGLPADHPDARASRRDLRYFNAALGNTAWLQRIIPGLVAKGERVLELGAGTGELGLWMNRAGVAWDGIDRAPRPEQWPASARWHQEDIFAFEEWSEYRVVVGNLILHHFTTVQLAQLGARLRGHCRAVAVGDLARGRLQQWSFLAYAVAIGANHVSRHDGYLSIRAGFRGEELARLLGLESPPWEISRERGNLLAHRIVALRRP